MKTIAGVALAAIVGICALASGAEAAQIGLGSFILGSDLSVTAFHDRFFKTSPSVQGAVFRFEEIGTRFYVSFGFYELFSGGTVSENGLSTYFDGLSSPVTTGDTTFSGTAADGSSIKFAIDGLIVNPVTGATANSVSFDVENSRFTASLSDNNPGVSAIPVSPVPLPGSLSLLGAALIGLAGAGFAARRTA